MAPALKPRAASTKENSPNWANNAPDRKARGQGCPMTRMNTTLSAVLSTATKSTIRTTVPRLFQM